MLSSGLAVRPCALHIMFIQTLLLIRLPVLIATTTTPLSVRDSKIASVVKFRARLLIMQPVKQIWDGHFVSTYKFITWDKSYHKTHPRTGRRKIPSSLFVLYRAWWLTRLFFFFWSILLFSQHQVYLELVYLWCPRLWWPQFHQSVQWYLSEHIWCSREGHSQSYSFNYLRLLRPVELARRP